jgi:hypothetical protein
MKNRAVSLILRWFAGLVTLIAGAGCSVATLGSARPVDLGTHQVVVAPSFVRISRGGTPYVGPQLELGERYGLSRRADIGVRLWLPMPGYVIDSRIALRRAPEGKRGLDLALQPGTSYLYVPGGDANASPLHIATLSLPLLAGVQLGHGRQIVLGAKVTDIVAIDAVDGLANIVTVGGSLGVVWPLSDNVSIAPEVGVGVGVLGSLAGYGSDIGVSGTTMQASIGFLFGGKAAPAAKCTPLPADSTPVD